MSSFIKSKKQQGAVLIISLVFLLMLTLITLYMTRGTLLQSKMAQGQRDLTHNFLAAESSLYTLNYSLSDPGPVRYQLIDLNDAANTDLRNKFTELCGRSIQNLNLENDLDWKSTNDIDSGFANILGTTEVEYAIVVPPATCEHKEEVQTISMGKRHNVTYRWLFARAKQSNDVVIFALYSQW